MASKNFDLIMERPASGKIMRNLNKLAFDEDKIGQWGRVAWYPASSSAWTRVSELRKRLEEGTVPRYGEGTWEFKPAKSTHEDRDGWGAFARFTPHPED